MSFNRISAAEAASLIKHGYNIGLSGFTPAGTAKAVTAELAKIAEAEHAKGNPFQVGIFTGASTGEIEVSSLDGVKTGDHPKQGGFTTARGPQQSEEFSLLDI